jgi:hypothetical protein
MMRVGGKTHSLFGRSYSDDKDFTAEYDGLGWMSALISMISFDGLRAMYGFPNIEEDHSPCTEIPSDLP